MAKSTTRVIQKRDDGKWENKKGGAERASSVHSTQKEAQDKAREQLKREGGELITKNEQGKIRSKDTISPGNDPYPPKG